MRVHENNRAFGSLIWEVLDDDDRVLAKCISKAPAEALLALLDDTKPFLVVQVAGGLVQDIHCPAGQKLDRTAYICDEDVEGADETDITTVPNMAGDQFDQVELCIHAESCDSWSEDSECLRALDKFLSRDLPADYRERDLDMILHNDAGDGI